MIQAVAKVVHDDAHPGEAYELYRAARPRERYLPDADDGT